MSNVKIVLATKDNKAEIAAQVESNEYTINRGGLNLPAGDGYVLLTAPNGDIFALKAIITNAGKKIALPIVSGTVMSKDGRIVAECGVGEKDKNLVLPFSNWLEMEPNSRYIFSLNEKGYVSNVSADMESLVLESEVLTKPSKKQEV